MTARASRVPAIGEVIHGKYRIDAPLGAGGMGVVFAAHHLGLDERVAIKFLTSNVALDSRSVERFLREGRAAVKIRGENVARMMDVDTLDDGSPYLVMEYLDGKELATMLEEQGTLDLDLALGLVMQTCEALAEAHALGIVHRDLKPSNLFLDHRPDGSLRVKVIDFGISKLSFAPAGVTSSLEVFGTPQYMSPEQLESARAVDARADIWSLGVILYELLTGQEPFPGSSVAKIFASILDRPPVPLRQHWAAATPQIEALLARCLEKDRSKRFADVGELARALADAGAPDGRAAAERIARILVPTSAKRMGTAALAAPHDAARDRRTVTADVTPPPWQTTRFRRGRPAFLIPILAAMATVGGGLGVAAALRLRTSPPSAATASPPVAVASEIGSVPIQEKVAPAVEPVPAIETASGAGPSAPTPRSSASHAAPAPKPKMARGALPPSAGPAKAAPTTTKADGIEESRK